MIGGVNKVEPLIKLLSKITMKLKSNPLCTPLGIGGVFGSFCQIIIVPLSRHVKWKEFSVGYSQRQRQD